VDWLFPIRTGVTFFDYWAIAHIAFWFFIGSSVAVSKSRRPKLLVTCLSIAFLWEIFEKFAEKKWPTVWLSPESWLNSWVSDPVMCLVGVLISWYGYDKWRK
jgi:hypothetical protein